MKEKILNDDPNIQRSVKVCQMKIEANQPILMRRKTKEDDRSNNSANPRKTNCMTASPYIQIRTNEQSSFSK